MDDQLDLFEKPPGVDPNPDAWIDELQALLKEWAECGTLERVIERREGVPRG